MSNNNTRDNKVFDSNSIRKSNFFDGINISVKIQIALLIFVIAITGAGAWVYTDPNSPIVNYTKGFQIGNSSLNATDVVTDNVTAKKIGGVIYADQYATLQDAIDACPSVCELYLGNSTYNNARLNISRSDVVLKGDGARITPDLTTTYAAYTGVVTITNTVRNVTIDGIVIDTLGKENSTLVAKGVSNLRVENSKFISPRNTTVGDGNVVLVADGVSVGGQISNSSDIFFENVEISGGAVAIQLYGGYYAQTNGNYTVYNNVHFDKMNIHDMVDSGGIKFYTYGSKIFARDVWIQNSIFNLVANSSWNGAAAVSVNYVQNVYIQNNKFENSYNGMAVDIHGAWDVFANNNQFNNTGNPFAIGGTGTNLYTRGADISGNLINNSNLIDWDGSEDVAFHHNIIKNSDCDVIGIFSGGLRRSITDNIFYNPYRNRSTGYSRPDCPSGANQNYTIGVADAGLRISGNTFEVDPAGKTTVQYAIFQQSSGQGDVGHTNIYENNIFKNISGIGTHSSATLPYKSIQRNNFNYSAGISTYTTVGSFTKDISTTTDTVITVGFRPTSVSFSGNLGDANNTFWGFDNSVNHVFTGHIWNGNYASGTSDSIYFSPSAGTESKARISGMNDTGFTLNWQIGGSPTGTATIIYQATP